MLRRVLNRTLFFFIVNIHKMVTYGKYDGSLMVILRQNRKGFFILDIYNKAGQRFRFYTIVNDQMMCNDIVHTSLFDTPEGIIDTLLDNVVSGTHKKRFWFFAKRIPDNLLGSYVKLVKEKYKG